MLLYRYELAKSGHTGDEDEDEELMSEYAPSELSDIIIAEGLERDDQADDDEVHARVGLTCFCVR